MEKEGKLTSVDMVGKLLANPVCIPYEYRLTAQC